MRHVDGISSSVNVTIEVVDALTGEVIETQERHNKVVAGGRNLLRDLLTGAATTGLTHFALGTDATNVTDDDAALGNEVHRDAITLATSEGTGGVLVRQFLSSLQANGETLAEAGLFTAASGGTMHARVTFEPIQKSSSVAINFYWTLTLEEVTS